MRRPHPTAARAFASIGIVWLIATLAAASPAAEPAPDPPARAETRARPIPVGAFCPARPADPLREASTFGVTALVMWALVRRRERRAAD